MLIVRGGISGNVFDSSIAHAHVLCSSRRTGARLPILLLCNRDIVRVTIEGWRSSVKEKGSLNVVVVECFGLNFEKESLSALLCPELISQGADGL